VRFQIWLKQKGIRRKKRVKAEHDQKRRLEKGPKGRRRIISGNVDVGADKKGLVRERVCPT